MTLQERLREDVKGCPFPRVYSNCTEAADALDAQEKRIKELEDRLTTLRYAYHAACEALK